MKFFEIESKEPSFYQWDQGQRLRVKDPAVNEVHFSNEESTITKDRAVYEDASTGDRMVDVPDELLQSALPITAYAFVDSGERAYTKGQVVFRVLGRKKPDGYVYTEEELKTWSELYDRMDKLEEQTDPEAVSKAVNEYLESHPVGVPTKVSAFVNDAGYITKQNLNGYAKEEDIPTVPTKVSAFENDKGYLTEQNLTGYAKTEDIPSLDGYAKTTDIPTDAHINNLINTALGVLENGSY